MTSRQPGQYQSQPNDVQRKPHVPPIPGEDGEDVRERKPQYCVRDDRRDQANQTVSCVSFHRFRPVVAVRRTQHRHGERREPKANIT